jgi:hypothetical protein
MLDNWIGFEILDTKGKVKYSMAWMTALPVSKTMSPRLSPAAERAGKSRTRASTYSKTTDMNSSTISAMAGRFSR